MSRSVTIVGGGVIGLSLGWELVQRGIETTIIQREDSTHSTSWSAAGILPPAKLELASDPLDKLRGLSHQLYPDWIARLESTTGIDCGFRRCGGWYLATSPGEHAAMVGMTGYWDELGVSCQAVSLSELAAQEPALTSWSRASKSTSAWWVADEWQIRPPHLLRALRAACETGGACFRDNTEVAEITAENGQVSLFIEGDWQPHQHVVLCAGAWTGRIGVKLGLQRSVIPVRGQMLLLKTLQPVLTGIVNVGQRYLVPRDDGHLLIGSCEEEVGFEKGTTSDMIQSLRQFAVSLVPSLETAEQVAQWSGIRPMTFDSFPMIGRVPGQSNLLVAAGHFRSGWHLAPATAECLAALIAGDEPPVPLEAFGVGKKQAKGDARTPSFTS